MSKKKENGSTALAEITETSAGYQAVQALKDEYERLKKQKDEPYVVTDLSELNSGLGSVKDVKDEKQLIMAYAMIKSAEAKFDESAKELGINPTKGFTIGGGSSEVWKKVIKRQYENVNHAERLKELEGLVKEAEQFVTEEEKKQLFLKKVSAYAAKVGKKDDLSALEA